VVKIKAIEGKSEKEWKKKGRIGFEDLFIFMRQSEFDYYH
jgi:hypothetical protein